MSSAGQMEADTRSSVTASCWEYENWFKPYQLDDRDWHPHIRTAQRYVDESAIGCHPFFTYASSHFDAVAAWVSQELVVTGPFSQLLLFVASKIENVHVRARVAKVAYGEHLGLRRGVASRAHPWLLDRLRDAIGVPETSVGPLPETAAFLEQLTKLCSRSTIAGVAAIGVGNEHLLLPEYEGMRNAFIAVVPDGLATDFFDANIREDESHSRFMYESAAILISQGANADEYLQVAKRSVDGRLQYYDQLLARVSSQRSYKWASFSPPRGTNKKPPTHKVT